LTVLNCAKCTLLTSIPLIKNLKHLCCDYCPGLKRL
jgi:hypothetical protein